MARTPRQAAEPVVQRPTVPPAEGLALLRQQAERAKAVIATGRATNDELRVWRIATEQVLAEALGRNHPLMLDVLNAGTRIWPADTEHEAAQERATELQAKLGALGVCIEHLEREVARSPPRAAPEAPTSVARVRRLLERLHRVARTLRDRYSQRETIKVDDEYDVQDLLRALLSIDFEDVRKEEWTPSYAGKSARMDLLLKQEQIVIEVKITRPGRAEKEIGDELIVDIVRYAAHPDCKTLVCFVYDPTGQIGNPASLERDLSGRRGELRVEVLVAPKH
jgi:hypothetical protein